MNIKKIGVFTSGGDSPGMNACIRAVVRAALYNNVKVMGIRRGYQGMIENEFVPLTSRSVSNILQRGGTFLQSARSKDFQTEEGRKKAYDNLVKHDINALVAIGGDGTFRGAIEFNKAFPDIKIIGIPGTIDNDTYGTDYSLGFDTAVNTVIDAVDKIRDTANSHHRLFFIEVMGRNSGWIAIYSGLAGGAEEVLLPEQKDSIGNLIKKLQNGAKMGKQSSIVIVAEGEEMGNAVEIAKHVKEKFDFYDVRVTVLGHIQRGGSPTCFDRVLAARLGVKSVEALIAGENIKMVGLIKNETMLTPFEDAVSKVPPFNSDLLRVAEILSY
jgi:6-phosphofructokinase 1